MKKLPISLSVIALISTHCLAQTNVPPVEWQKVYGGLASDAPKTLKATADGGFYIGGGTDSGMSATKSTPTYGQEDCWVVRCDAQGNKIWERAMG